MDKELNPKQERELIDFLKRWGIDHPELLAEMADHYAEKALAEMAAGKSWEQVLNSWKTKETFRSLRTIQKTFEDQYPGIWRKTQWEIAKDVFFDGRLFIVIICSAMVFWLDSRFDMHFFLGILVVIKFALAYVIMTYTQFNKRLKAILSFKDFGVFGGFYAAMMFVFYDHLFVFMDKFETPVLPSGLSIVFLGGSVLVDMFGYRLYRHTIASTKHLTKQMLTEHIPQPFQGRAQ